MTFMAIGIFIFIKNKKKYYYYWMWLFIFIAIFSFADFYRWEYNYGHSLDPRAPIQIPGMAYQPPLIGYKKMLNFEALSQPHIAGWFYIAAGLLLVTVSYFEFKKSKK